MKAEGRIKKSAAILGFLILNSAFLIPSALADRDLRLKTDGTFAGGAANLDPGQLKIAGEAVVGGSTFYRNILQVASEAVDERIEGVTAGAASQALYSTLNNATSSYVRNSSHFAADVDFTSVAVYNNAGDAARVTLVAPDIGIGAHHLYPANGTVVRFVTANGTAVNLTVGSSSQIGSTDIRVIKFTSSAPSTITPAKVVNAEQIAQLLNAPTVYLKNNQNLYIGDITATSTLSVLQSADDARDDFYSVAVSGDSSHPLYVILDGQAVLIGTWNAPTVASNIGRSVADINAAMTSLGSSYQLTEFPMSVLTAQDLGGGVQFYDAQAVPKLSIDTGAREAYTSDGTTVAFSWGVSGIATPALTFPTVGAGGIVFGASDIRVNNAVGGDSIFFVSVDNDENIIFRDGAVTISPAGVITGNGSGLTTLNATNLSSGTVATARLGSGTANSSTYLRGDGTWAAAGTSFSDSSGLRGLLSDETGTGLAVFNSNPILLFPEATQSANEIDVTQFKKKTSESNSYTFTFSATPSSGQAFGLRLTNGDSTADVVTLPANVKSMTRQGATLSSFTLAGSAVALLTFEYDGTNYWLSGEPITVNDATTATAAAGDFWYGYDTSAGADAKFAAQIIGTDVQAYDADLSTYAGITPSANVQTLLGAANYAAFKTSLSLTVGTDVQAYDADLTTWAGVTPGSGVATALAVANNAAGGYSPIDGTATLSNKTLTAPKFADLGFIADANGNEILILDTVTSAVNEITLANAATGNRPTISATGGDTNIGITLTPKGTGGVNLGAGAISTPALTLAGDSGTGWYRPAADQWHWATGSASILGLFNSVIRIGNGLGVTFGSASAVSAGTVGINRAADKVLEINDAGSAGGTLRFKPTTPAQITANQNNYNPGGSSLYQRWSTDASRNITGLTFTAAQVDGQTHVIVNVGSFDIVLQHLTTSTAGNQFQCSTAADITITPGNEVNCWYDSTTAKWRISKRGF